MPRTCWSGSNMRCCSRTVPNTCASQPSSESRCRSIGHWSGERRLRRADGSLIWVQVSKRLVRAGDTGGGMIASYVNVDDRRRAEESLLMQSERTRAILDSVLVGIVIVGTRWRPMDEPVGAPHVRGRAA